MTSIINVIIASSLFLINISIISPLSGIPLFSQTTHSTIRTFIDENQLLENNLHTLSKPIDVKETIIYHDDDIIVVNKPHDINTAPGLTDQSSFATLVAEHFHLPRVDHMIAHRLDYATSGVLVLARNLDALKVLNRQFRGGLYKRYSAIVDGLISPSEGEIELMIRKNMTNPPCQMVDNINGKWSNTKWTVLDRGRYNTHVYLEPETGRTHQLRVHMASIGHPMLGDFFYSPPAIFTASNRLLLHAEELRFAHPRTGVMETFRVPCPFSIDQYDVCSS